MIMMGESIRQIWVEEDYSVYSDYFPEVLMFSVYFASLCCACHLCIWLMLPRAELFEINDIVNNLLISNGNITNTLLFFVEKL